MQPSPFLSILTHKLKRGKKVARNVGYLWNFQNKMCKVYYRVMGENMSNLVTLETAGTRLILQLFRRSFRDVI
jgi:hypothetical protein